MNFLMIYMAPATSSTNIQLLVRNLDRPITILVKVGISPPISTKFSTKLGTTNISKNATIRIAKAPTNLG